MNSVYQIRARIERYPAGTHRLRGPCSPQDLTALEQHLGKLPLELEALLRQFDGAKLFLKTMPLISFFPAIGSSALNRLVWSHEWTVRTYTQKWRGATGTENEWAFAMKNYGAVAILNTEGLVREWETAMSKWSPKALPFVTWIDRLVAEGEMYVREA